VGCHGDFALLGYDEVAAAQRAAIWHRSWRWEFARRWLEERGGRVFHGRLRGREWYSGGQEQRHDGDESDEALASRHALRAASRVPSSWRKRRHIGGTTWG